MNFIGTFWKLRIDGTQVRVLTLNLKADSMNAAYSLAKKLVRLSDGSLSLIGVAPGE